MAGAIWRAGVWIGFLTACVLLVGCNTLIKSREDCDDTLDGTSPNAKGCGKPTMHSLAGDMDCLEGHIDKYGSVVAKVPDVWGQARLTQYREEFEKEMANDIGGFKTVISGSEARSDQAYFASATALSLAAQPQPPVIGRVTSTKSAGPTLVPTEQVIERVTEDKTTGAKTTTKTTEQKPTPDPAPKAPDPVKLLDLDDPNKLVSDTDKVLGKRTDVQLTRLGFAGASQGGAIGLEPGEMLAQKKRYLDLLNQIRRENEGDDTADSPGYSLNLMRIPVSILPGKRTEIGYGAEITMSLTPVLGDDLLPMTFRNLLTNDLTNQLGFPITQILNEEEGEDGLVKLLDKDFNRFVRIIVRLSDYLSDLDPQFGGYWRALQLVGFLYTRAGNDDLMAFEKFATTEMRKDLNDLKKQSQASGPALSLMQSAQNKNGTATLQSNKGYESLRAVLRVRKFASRVNVPPLSFANGLDNRTAFPTSQLLDVYGPQASFEIAFGAHEAFEKLIAQQKYAHLPDIQSYLKEETRAAYLFLHKNPQLWHTYCTPRLVQMVRSQEWDAVNAIRQQYRKEVAILTGSEPSDPNAGFDPAREPGHLSKTSSLAWCLIVDAALLNDRLIRDMKETASAKGKSLVGCEEWCPYFLPDPPPECRRAFNDYVALRWPIHVFALDPYVQEQNIADALSTRRETQLALSIAFTNGQISARNMTKFVRRLEAEYETIALNRTQIGFSHGENTFGWRFYPRFQTPDTPSNAEVLIREQLIGGPNRDDLLRQRRLEPGPRECVAVVMMPSFVPYVSVDTVSNWFPITNPKNKVLDTTQAMRLSRTVQEIKTTGCGVKDGQKYRPGEVERLLRRADQLEARLPTQTLVSAVPILNTLGGFEMFSNGTTDLAPELFGWYGAPGIDPTADTTTLFLVGDHFSPLRSKVIVGNEMVKPENQKMLSRQVMQVTFTKPLYAFGGPNGKEVRIHLATPYGVTRELAVPWVKQLPTAAPGRPPSPVSISATPS